MSTDSMSTDQQSTALAMPSEAERRVQLAKDRLAAHLTALDLRARQVARQTAWVAGAVLLGLAGVATAAAMFGRVRRRNVYDGERREGRGVGTALVLAALGLLSRRVRVF